MAEPLASIIIPARDEEENLRRCLRAVRAQQADFEYEVLVVDSGSRDRTAAVAAEFGARVIAIRRDEFQHGRTRQLASEQARGEFLVYLVADAEPADERWLSSLVRAAAEDGVAGAYSRQLPRAGAGPVEALKLRHRPSSGEARAAREAGADFWSLPPLERLWRCEFDDVSCCRRRAALLAVPIPAVDWAEDLLWAREALLSGWRIVFEPASVVRHSHPDTIRHAFRRGWLDQDVARRGFGVIYWESVARALAGWPRLYADQAEAIIRAGQGSLATAKMLGWNAVRLAAEIAGNLAAAAGPADETVTADLLPALVAGPLRRRSRGQVLATSFTLGEDTRPVLFMNPDAAAVARAWVPEDGRLKFGAGLNPLARRHRPGPVRFIAAVNGEAVFDRELAPGTEEKPAFVNADLSLARWAGRRATFTFITRAARTDYAWAGWAAPRIVTPGLGRRERLINNLRALAEGEARGEPLRHP